MSYVQINMVIYCVLFSNMAAKFTYVCHKSLFFDIFWCAQAPSLVSLHTMFSSNLVLGIIMSLKVLKCVYSHLYLLYLVPG